MDSQLAVNSWQFSVIKIEKIHLNPHRFDEGFFIEFTYCNPKLLCFFWIVIQNYYVFFGL